MALKFGHRSSGNSSSKSVSPVVGFHGFQGIQTITLGNRRQLRLCFVLEFVLSMRAFLRAIACDERVMLELGAPAVWQLPTSSRKEVQLIVHVSRSLSDQFFRVARSLVILNFQHITAMHNSFECLLRTGACNRDWCQRRNELLSSICRHGLLEHQESHHSVHDPRFQQGKPELAQPLQYQFHHRSQSCWTVSRPRAPKTVPFEKSIAP